MKRNQGFISLVSIAAIVLMVGVLGGGVYVYKNKKIDRLITPSDVSGQTETKTTEVGGRSADKGGFGGSDIDISSVNDFPISDFTVTAPQNGEKWNKGESGKSIRWIYPPELRGSSINLKVHLINLDLLKKGRSSGDPDVSLIIYNGLVDVPVSGKGEVAWDLLRVVPETPFYGYTGNSRILITINDTKKIKVYNGVSDSFMVTPNTVPSTTIVPIEITSPYAKYDYKIGDSMEVAWKGSTHPSDICELSLVGPIDQGGQVIQALGAIIPMGSILCSTGAFTWRINNMYLHAGYPYNLIIKSPYNTYTRIIMISS